MLFLRYLLAISLGTFLISSCANIDSRKAMTKWKSKATSGFKKVDDLSALKIPILSIVDPGPGFTTTHSARSRSGSYSIWHNGKFPEGNVEIGVIGSPRPAPEVLAPPTVLEPDIGGGLDEEFRNWRSVFVPGLNRNLRYYLVSDALGGSEKTWETEIFSYTDLRGRTGSYQAVFAGAEEKSAPRYFARIQLVRQ